MIYVACPYTHEDIEVKKTRFRLATIASTHLLEQGHIVLSPITQTHPMDIIMAEEGETLGTDFWLSFDKAMMDACDQIVVLTIDGWQESVGVKREIEYFISKDKPVHYLSKSEINASDDILKQFNKLI